MTPERWAQIEELFHRAAECDPKQRAALLDENCRGDLELRQEVESLLSREAGSGNLVRAAVHSELDSFGFSLIGEVVSHYRILDGLGGGGMGLVYRAEDIKLGRQVALKFLPEESAKEPAALARFEREARAASALSHPNICTIYEIEEHEGQPFIVMELLEGQTLRELITAAAPLASDRLMKLALQISEGLDAAHSRGIIHRDIKPANILVTAHGQAKILDFGLAKLSPGIQGEVDTCAGDRGDELRYTEPGAVTNSGGDLLLSRAGLAIGTAGYMSPEQARGDRLDARTDLFSFGLVLYEMAVGRRAFTGETVLSIEAAILTQEPIPVRDLNPEIPVRLEIIINKALSKDRELRYQTAAEMGSDLRSVLEEEWPRSRESEATSWPGRLPKLLRNPVLLSAGATLLIAASVFFVRAGRGPALGEKDMIMVSDFVNTTGDSIFDGALKQALTVKLAESPYFNVLPEPTLREMLRLMGRSPDERIVPPVAREVCQRTGAKVLVAGAIIGPGNKYVISVDATNCLTGAVVAHEDAEAENRDFVVRTLGRTIPPLREKLGESLSSIEKFDTPIEQATTKSLAALKAYTSGDEQRVRAGDAESVPFYKMAIDLDPDFAVAYARLGAIYSNLANAALADEYLKKAFERREHVSQREKFYIVAHYYADATREIDKAVETLQLWTRTYPRDWVAFNNLSAEALKIGQFDQAIKAGQEALRLNPNNMFAYYSLSFAFLRASRFAEAKAICEQSIRAKRDSGDIHGVLLTIALVEGDGPAFQRQLDWFQVNQKLNPSFLDQQASIAFTLGQVRKGRRLFERSRAASVRLQSGNSALGGKDYAAFSTGNEAQLEEEIGNLREARAKAEHALRLMPESTEAQASAAVIFASLGDFRRAEQLGRKLSERFPSDTLLNAIALPSIRAAAEIRKKNPGAAIEELRPSTPYDFGSRKDLPDGIALYYRGLAYLALGSGEQAAAQFQKLLENRGMVAISPYWPLAHLGLARAYALEARIDEGTDADAGRTRARNAYQEFFALWKDADPDIPILKEAKAEYARLQ